MDDGRTHPDEQFAARLNKLFEEKRRPDGKEWPNSEVGARCGMSRQQVHNLRHPKGSRSRGPTYETITLLAQFFGVDPSYFFQADEAPPTEPGDTELSRRLADLNVQHLAANTVGGGDITGIKEALLLVLQRIQDFEDQTNGGPSPTT
ncbi:helix-turn-helix domain-containing protein [Micromonospora sp. NPDC049366]|uniref:helix-turn-helix domain-containing protein n=1 Tax=Micromonospora sp. NPDC049366 TaxID=3364271 RepID=UPI0037960711